MLGRARGGVDYRFLGAIAPGAGRRRRSRARHARRSCRACSTAYDVDELIVTDSDLDSEQLLEAQRRGVPQRRHGAHRGEDDGGAHAARRVRARPGRAAVRAAAAGLRGHGLARQARLRPRRQRARARRRTAAVDRDRDRREALVARAGLLPRPARRPRRARVRDAQVPDDGRRRGRASARARTGERGRRARCSRSATIRASRASGVRCAASRSTRSRRC